MSIPSNPRSSHSLPSPAQAPSTAPAAGGQAKIKQPGNVFLFVYFLAYIGSYIGIMGPSILSLYTRLSDLFPAQGSGMTATGALALVSGVGAIVAALANPLIGRLSDRTTSSMGMRRPWILISSGIFAAGILVIAFAPANLVVITLGWALSQGGCNGLLAVYTALLPDQIPEKYRGSMSSYLGIGMNASALVGVWLVGLFPAGNVIFDAAGNPTGGASSSIWRFIVPLAVAVGTALLIFVVLKPIDRRLSKTQVRAFTVKELASSFVFDPRKSADFTWAWVSRFFFMLGIAYLIVYQTPYFQLHLGYEGNALDSISVWGQLVPVSAMVLMGLVSGKWSDSVHRRKIFVIASALLYATSLLFMVVAPANQSGTTLAMIGLFIGGLAQGTYFGIDLALVTDVLPDADSAGKDLGVFNIASAVPQFIAPFIAPLFLGLSWFGGKAGSNFVVLFLAAAVFSAIGAFLVLPVRRVR